MFWRFVESMGARWKGAEYRMTSRELGAFLVKKGTLAREDSL